jgi:two-component system, NtrC family, sensor kinase
MPSDLTQFGLAQMLRCSLGVRRAAMGAATFEDAAVRMNDYLYDILRSESSGTRQLVLARIYKTHPYTALEPAQRAFADSLLNGPPDPNLQCLCLMATRGEEDGWNDRKRSRGHLAIPLVSTERIEQAPMIAAMMTQFGVDVGLLVNPTRELLSRLAGKTYGVFHVEDAAGSPFIPAQEDFVARHGIRSVVGFGGALPTGAIFAAILFSRARIAPDVADRFRGIALDAKSMLFPFDDASTFGRPAANPE